MQTGLPSADFRQARDRMKTRGKRARTGGLRTKSNSNGRARRPTTLSMKYIKRHEGNGTKGWRVAFLKRHTAESRFWADRKHGGRDKALAKAMAWRDTMMRKHNIPSTPRRLPVPWTRC